MPLAIFLIPYALFLIFFIVIALSALYHVVRFGFVTPVTIGGTIIFLILTVIALAVSGIAINGIDWSAKIVIGVNARGGIQSFPF